MYLRPSATALWSMAPPAPTSARIAKAVCTSVPGSPAAGPHEPFACWVCSSHITALSITDGSGESNRPSASKESAVVYTREGLPGEEPQAPSADCACCNQICPLL